MFISLLVFTPFKVQRNEPKKVQLITRRFTADSPPANYPVLLISADDSESRTPCRVLRRVVILHSIALLGFVKWQKKTDIKSGLDSHADPLSITAVVGKDAGAV